MRGAGFGGRLYGRCYDCCRGRGRQGGLDIYAHLVPETSLLTEEMLAKIFKKECNRRHRKRSGVKKNDYALLKRPPPLTRCRRHVFEFCKSAAKSSVDCVKGDDPLLYEELRQIARRYKEGKRIQAEEGDAQGIPCPHPEVVGVQVQNLHRVMPGTDRFFICRQEYCTPAGSFFGLNTDWISTADAGGWKFACPACGTPYKANVRNKPGLIPANHIWHVQSTDKFMLAEWPETLEEKSINE